MVLRAFAAHPRYCQSEEVRWAGELLKARFFQADKYNDRKAPGYWLKFQYPFRWTSLLTALDSLSRLGFPLEDADVQAGLAWFVDNQEADGLWPTGYGKGRRAVAMRPWVGLAVCRVFLRLVAEREARFEVLDQIRRRMPEVSVNEVQVDTAEAVASVRADAEAEEQATGLPGGK